MEADVLTLEHDQQVGEALLQPCLRAGKRLDPAPSLADIRQRAAMQLASLPEHLQRLQVEPPYSVIIAPTLHALADEVDRQT
jgi:nicotinate phosphoribosyltransferase